MPNIQFPNHKIPLDALKATAEKLTWKMNALGGKHVGAGSRLRPSFCQPVECSDRSATNRLSLRISMETKLNSRKRSKTTLKGRDPMQVVTKWPRCAKEQCGAAHTNKQGALHQGKHLPASIIRRHVCDDAVHHGPVVKPRAPNGRSLIFGGLKLNVVCGPWHAPSIPGRAVLSVLAAVSPTLA